MPFDQLYIRMLVRMRSLRWTVTTLAALRAARRHAVRHGPDRARMVGEAATSSTKNIVKDAVNSKDHIGLVAAVKASGWSTCCRSAS